MTNVFLNITPNQLWFESHFIAKMDMFTLGFSKISEAFPYLIAISILVGDIICEKIFLAHVLLYLSCLIWWGESSFRFSTPTFGISFTIM